MNTLACMGGTEILIVLFIVFGGGLALFFVSLIPYRFAVRMLAKSPTPRGPGTLFAATLGLAVAWASVITLAITLIIDFRDSSRLIRDPGLLVGLCGMVGSVAFLFLLLLRKQGNEQDTLPAGLRAHKPYQIWAQDLFIALLCYGAGLTILSFLVERPRGEDFLTGAIYILMAGTTGLLFAADLCRRTDAGQTAPKRAAIFVGVFTFFPLLFPLAVLAWWRWRRALTLQKNLAKAAH